MKRKLLAPSLESHLDVQGEQFDKNRSDILEQLKELEELLKSRDYTRQHDYKFLVEENKKLHKEVNNLKHDNKMLSRQIDDKMNILRKSGL